MAQRDPSSSRAGEDAPLPPSPGGAAVGSGPWQCVADPAVETYLRCGRCERPICPRCLIQTPVGAKCRECAQLRKLPMFDVKPIHYVRAVGAALGAGLGGWLVLALVQGMVPMFGLFNLLLMAGYGYLVGEAVSVAVRRKQGNQLGMIAAAGVVLGSLIAHALFLMTMLGVPAGFTADHFLLSLAVALSSMFGSLWGMLGLLVAAGVAYSRAR